MFEDLVPAAESASPSILGKAHATLCAWIRFKFHNSRNSSYKQIDLSSATIRRKTE